MTTVLVHFTIPIRYGHIAKGCNSPVPGEDHPIVPEATADDWFDVEVHEATDTAEAENLARLMVNDRYGNQGWMSTYLDGPRWEDLKAKYAPGRCVKTLEVWS